MLSYILACRIELLLREIGDFIGSWNLDVVVYKCAFSKTDKYYQIKCRNLRTYTTSCVILSSRYFIE